MGTIFLTINTPLLSSHTSFCQTVAKSCNLESDKEKLIK